MKMLARAAALVLATIPCAASAQTDPFANFSDTVSSACRRWAAVTPSDSTNLTDLPKALYVGGAGDIAMIGVDAATGASAVTWKSVQAGSILPVRPRRVLVTGTNATSIVACY